MLSEVGRDKSARHCRNQMEESESLLLLCQALLREAQEEDTRYKAMGAAHSGQWAHRMSSRAEETWDLIDGQIRSIWTPMPHICDARMTVFQLKSC